MASLLETLSAELAAHVHRVYVKYKDSTEMNDLLRISSKITLLSENDYEGLWVMENEDKMRAEAAAKQMSNEIVAQNCMIEHLTRQLEALKNPGTSS